jgi:hypothetical protein
LEGAKWNRQFTGLAKPNTTNLGVSSTGIHERNTVLLNVEDATAWFKNESRAYYWGSEIEEKEELGKRTTFCCAWDEMRKYEQLCCNEQFVFSFGQSRPTVLEFP